jgi:hypothetical protein
MKKGISNHTIYTLGFVLVVVFVGYVVAQGAPNPGHDVSQISGIPNCVSGEVLTKDSNGFRCEPLSVQSLVFGSSFPIDDLGGTSDFFAMAFQAIDSSNPNNINGRLHFALRSDSGGIRFETVTVVISGSGTFGNQVPTRYEYVHSKQVNGFSFSQGAGSTNTNVILNDFQIGSGGSGFYFPINGANKDTQITITMVSRDPSQGSQWTKPFTQMSYGMRKYSTNWGAQGNTFTFNLAK